MDVIEEVHEGSARLYLVSVHPGLEEARVANVLRARQGTDCVELTGERAREFLERRRNFDWTAESSGMRLSNAEPDALLSAHAHHREEHGQQGAERP